MHSPVALSSLPLGATLAAPLHDEQQTKLLGAGIEITEHLLTSLKKRSVDSVVVSEDDLGRINAYRPQGKSRTALPDRVNARTVFQTESSRVLDRKLLAMPEMPIAPSGNPFSARVQRPAANSTYDRDFLNHLAEQHERGIRHLLTLTSAVAAGDASDIPMVAGIVGEKLDECTEDIDAFVCLGANPFGLGYPNRHSTHVAMLAMAMATNLQLDEHAIVELGIGCWIHDIGMIAIDRATLESGRVLEPSEYAEITKHPLTTLELIHSQLDHLSLASQFVAYQMHERSDGSGYPRGRTQATTHPLARIAAVADAYTALVAPRPHRPGMLPYFAVEKLLQDARSGRFDPKAIRALLQTVGLFPIGSFVALNHEDFVGRVIRSGGDLFSRPVIEVWKRTNMSAKPSVINLADESRLEIVKPIVSPAV